MRGRLVISKRASFPLAQRLREPQGAPLGEVFSFVSGLYFRGKLAYARAFATPPDPGCPILGGGVLVITPATGLRPADSLITLPTVRAFARVEVNEGNPRYRRPLEADARAVAGRISSDCEVILLGSIASEKYVGVLSSVFRERLRFPAAFVGRGDMSRGGLMLRCVAQQHELDYIPVTGAARRGPRPARLAPLVRMSNLARPW